MKKILRKIAWFYDFDRCQPGIFLKAGKKKKAATIHESELILKQGGGYLALNKHLKAPVEQLWIPEQQHKISIFPSRRDLNVLVEMITKDYYVSLSNQRKDSEK
jgi:hypothetical protein